MRTTLYISTLLLLFGFGCNLNAQTENFLKNRISIEGFYTRNIGNFSEVWASSAGGYLGYGIAFPEHKLLIIRTGFISNNLKSGVNFQDASSSIIPLEIGGRYYIFDSSIMPFAQFINGINFLFENTNLKGQRGTKTLIRYAWQIGLGMTVSLMGNFYLDLGVNYQSDFYHVDAMNTGFEYVLGFGYAFGN